jgi:hypothetical protein
MTAIAALACGFICTVTEKNAPAAHRAGAWASANNAEIAYPPANSSWLNRIEAQFTSLRYFALEGTGHPSHREQASMIRRYIIWRHNHAYDDHSAVRGSPRTVETL